ncbi:ABC-F family ATP-binding cassette domain-containing protein [Petroclostridium sp. X23]|uniref:ABC-F family ATP-binding cassette domain-containing protein n=1 Tax=Petroclostridium sp. X23 TaxID=3045146 RepID=UPI0024ADA0AE|nr:ABC-F family ATP-binding cassette domain-containing protein [Petroclostridium sp. X23]WHH61270.1 ABC-F family ATP-binding cassette domain-containing protein [Petroclostridium sp. X23]
MNLLTVENISKSYSEKILLDNISMGIGAGDKIGVIGINGTGKSTFLKILAGIEYADQGNITTVNGLRIEYLPQNPNFIDNATVLQQVFKGNSPIMELIREYESTLQRINNAPDDTHLQQKLVNLNQKMDALDGWRIESDAKTILTRLGIHDFDTKVGTLSGGQRKRVAMASALITPADLLILDEPTNHIDNETVDWLEEHLNNRKGALLMVTHDRYFLDRVANRIIELDRGNLYSYTGNYSLFLEKKLEREELEKASERKRQNLLRNELAWIKRGAKARSTKQKARIDRFEKLQSSQPEFISGKIEIAAGSSRLGKKVIDLIDIDKVFGEKLLISDFSYTFLRNDRVGIIGPNGSGKSTLLKMIAGNIAPDSGKVERGQTVKIAFFSQENEGMDENLRVIEYIREVAEYLETPDGSISASQMLERFLFAPAVQWTPIAKLSGGEKRRLYLLRVLMSAPNIILLDEPTNDLDIQTLTILESYLDEFPGAVIVVSHDRYFLDRVVDKIFSFEGSGKIRQTIGNYSDYREYLEQHVTQETKETPKAEKNINERDYKKNRPLKLSYKEQKEYEQIDGIIEGLEKKISDIGIEINAAASDYTLLQELTAKQLLLEKQLEEAVDRWAYLNELVEEIERAQQ